MDIHEGPESLQCGVAVSVFVLFWFSLTNTEYRIRKIQIAIWWWNEQDCQLYFSLCVYYTMCSMQMLWLKVPNCFVESYICLFLLTIFLHFCKQYFSVSANHISQFLQTIFLSVCKSYFSVSANYISQCRSIESSALVEMRRRCQIALLLPPAHFRSSTNYLNYPSTALKNSFLCKYNRLNYPSTSTELPKYSAQEICPVGVH